MSYVTVNWKDIKEALGGAGVKYKSFIEYVERGKDGDFTAPISYKLLSFEGCRDKVYWGKHISVIHQITKAILDEFDGTGYA